MKLEKRISLFNLSLSVILLSLGAILLSVLLHQQFKRIDHRMMKAGFTPYILAAQENLRLDTLSLKTGISIAKITPEQAQFFKPSRVKLAFDSLQHPNHPPQKPSPHTMTMTIDLLSKGEWYRVTNQQIHPPRGELLNAITISIFVIFGLLLLLLSVGNHWLIRHILHPFHAVLDKIDNFSIQKKPHFMATNSTVEEFQVLDAKTTFLMEKATLEYEKLKEFSENASHELQTPLAIVRAKLDILLQSENLKEAEMAQVFLAQTALLKMSKLNETLLLLHKIDNHQFESKEEVDFQEILEGLLRQMQEMILLKKITLETDLESVLKNNNPYLIELLLTNLLANAIRHNRQDGTGAIKIVLKKEMLEISNLGDDFDGNVQEIFDRFKKGKKKNDSMGLGLAIVKKIVDTSGYSIEYAGGTGKHCFTLRF